MLMNKSYKNPVVATITLNGVMDDLKYFNVITKQWEEVVVDNSSGNSRFDAALRPGGGKLFSMENKQCR